MADRAQELSSGVLTTADSQIAAVASDAPVTDPPVPRFESLIIIALPVAAIARDLFSLFFRRAQEIAGIPPPPLPAEDENEEVGTASAALPREVAPA